MTKGRQDAGPLDSRSWLQAVRRPPAGPGWPQPLAPGSPRTYMKVMARRIDNQDSLDPRTRQLLRALIGRYIRDGQPVGSQTLARHAGLDVSPAPLRHILSDLPGNRLLAPPPTPPRPDPTPRGLRVTPEG